MSAKAYDKKTAAFAGFMIQNFPDTLTNEIMDGWMNNPAATKKFLTGLVPPPKAAESSALFFSVIATTQVAATDAKKTSKCFANFSRYHYRDGDFDPWLPANQPKADACAISTLGFERDWTFVETAAKILGVGASRSVKLIGKALIENGHTVTLAQIEEMVEATERRANTGMQTNSYWNFFFVETGNEDDPVSVAGVSRDVSGWNAGVRRLGYDSRWSAVVRLLVCNLDASKLGS
ncbi:MAG TPA: hypothetical protein VNF51_01640 [Candidatus Paceibacterota bacterium]|nr:hypothetical protein [Candidatus Paceibacterota bacterium]